MTCKIESCDKPVKARGYCATHHRYLLRTGREWTPGTGAVQPMASKFWPKVDTRPGLGPNGDCWEWRAAVQRATGYGLIGKGGFGAGSEGVHRVSYRMHHGDIPDGMLVMHTCDNRLCVNPAHLRLGTYKDNTRDMIAKGRRRLKHQVKRGDELPHSKLNADIVRAIRAEVGLTAKQLGAKYEISPAQANKIFNRQSWAHIE